MNQLILDLYKIDIVDISWHVQMNDVIIYSGHVTKRIIYRPDQNVNFTSEYQSYIRNVMLLL